MAEDKDPTQEVEAARSAFEHEFERFANLASVVAMDGAERGLEALREMRTRHLGKKSAIAASKKLIGRVPSEDRASFGQLVQKTEAVITQSIVDVEAALTAIIEAARTARDAIDVTIPGRRPRQGHLHPITLMRQRIEDIFVSLGYAVEDDR